MWATEGLGGFNSLKGRQTEMFTGPLAPGSGETAHVMTSSYRQPVLVISDYAQALQLLTDSRLSRAAAGVAALRPVHHRGYAAHCTSQPQSRRAAVAAGHGRRCLVRLGQPRLGRPSIPRTDSTSPVPPTGIWRSVGARTTAWVPT